MQRYWTLEKVERPIDSEINTIKQKDNHVVQNRNADDFIPLVESSHECVGCHGDDNKANCQRSLGPSVQAKPIHLSQNQHGAEAKREHGPHVVALQNRNHRSVNQYKELEKECPPRIDMCAVEDQRGLCEQHEHIEKAQQMPPCAFGGMIPKRVDGCPRKEIAMIFADDFHKAFFEFEVLSEDQAAARRFKNDDDHQHHRYGAKRSDLRHICGEAIEPKLGLDDVKDDEANIGCDQNPIEPAQIICELWLFALSEINDRPHDEIVKQVQAPSRQGRESSWLEEPPRVGKWNRWSNDLKTRQVRGGQSDDRGKRRGCKNANGNVFQRWVVHMFLIYIC